MKKKFKKVKVNPEWINSNLTKPGWQRNLYPSRVNFFVNHIKNETFKNSLITVAKVDGEKFVLLDGQHKVEAIAKANYEITMDICICENMEEEEMVEEYKRLNDVKPQRIIDDIKLYVGKHDWLDAFMEKTMFPINVTLSGGVNSIRIDRFLNILKNGMIIGFYRQNLTRKKVKPFLDELDSEVFRIMKEFCILYKKCFGEPAKDNWLYNNSVMYNLMRVWNVNKNSFSEDEFVKCFKPIEKNTSVRMDVIGVDMATLQSLAHKIYAVINRGRSKNKFKEFWLEDEGE